VSIHQLFEIRREVSRRTRILLAIASWTLVVLVWFLLTDWDLLPPFSLPKPAGVVQAFARLWTEYDLLGNVF
jgi:ABC-type nitrate/sulfonate/bicarbonate transport system permease component